MRIIGWIGIWIVTTLYGFAEVKLSDFLGNWYGANNHYQLTIELTNQKLIIRDLTGESAITNVLFSNGLVYFYDELVRGEIHYNPNSMTLRMKVVDGDYQQYYYFHNPYREIPNYDKQFQPYLGHWQSRNYNRSFQITNISNTVWVIWADTIKNILLRDKKKVFFHIDGQDIFMRLKNENELILYGEEGSEIFLRITN